MAGGYIPRPIPPKPRKWPRPGNKFDIVTRLRSTRASMIGTADEGHYFDCHEAAGEIERLRQFGGLTRGERRALEFAIGVYPLDDSIPDTLRALLERLG